MFDTFTGETYDTLCRDAEEFLAKGSPDQAKELLHKAISLISTRSRARSILADTCMVMEAWTEAREQLEVLITLDENNPENHMRLAQVLEEMGEYQLAMDNYGVVLELDPDNHDAQVAVKRISSRAGESGIDLTKVFGIESGSRGQDAAQAGQGKKGVQVYPDVPSEDVFAASDGEEDDDDGVDALLRNIGLTGESVGKEEDSEVSKLLEDIGVSTSASLAAAFGEPGDEGKTGEEDAEGKPKRKISLDEIFGTSPVMSENVFAATETGEDVLVVPQETGSDLSGDEGEPGEEREVSGETLVPADKEDSVPVAAPGDEKAVSEKDNPPEEIFKASEEEPTEGSETVEEETPVNEEVLSDEGASAAVETDVVEAAFAEEAEQVGDAVRADGKTEDHGIREDDTAGVTEKEVESRETIPEEEETGEAVSVEGAASEEDPEEPGETPGEESPGDPVPEETDLLVLECGAEFSIDHWSPESGLLAVDIVSGSLRLPASLLSVIEDTLKVLPAEDGSVEISGNGTFLMNCGTDAPLTIVPHEGTILRRSMIVMHTGLLKLEPVDSVADRDLVVIRETEGGKVLLTGSGRSRVILLGYRNRIFLVRTASIAAAEPGISISDAADGYTRISGTGKVFLIE